MFSIIRKFIGTVIFIHALVASSTFCFAATESKISESSFLSELTTTKYKGIKNPEEPLTIEWDFSDEKTYTYSFKTNVLGRSKMDIISDKASEMQNQTSSTATMLIRSKGDGTADVVLKNVTQEMLVREKEGGGPETMEMKGQPQVFQGLNENGTVTSANPSSIMFIRSLFALPSKPLGVGHSEKIPAEVPFNAMGSVLQVRGNIMVTLARYVEIDGKVHAEIIADFDVSRINVPPDLEGEYRYAMKGKSFYYFDIKDKSVVSGSTAMLETVYIKTSMPQIKANGEKPDALVEPLEMEMSSDSFMHFEMVK